MQNVNLCWKTNLEFVRKTAKEGNVIYWKFPTLFCCLRPRFFCFCTLHCDDEGGGFIMTSKCVLRWWFLMVLRNYFALSFDAKRSNKWNNFVIMSQAERRQNPRRHQDSFHSIDCWLYLQVVFPQTFLPKVVPRKFSVAARKILINHQRSVRKELNWEQRT